MRSPFRACTGVALMFAASAAFLQAQPGGNSQGGAIPMVEAPLVLPGVTRGSEACLIVYRHSNPAFPDVWGYDTVIVRFTGDPEGELSGASIFERRLAGDKLSATYRSVATQGGTVVMEISDSGTRDKAWMKEAQDWVELGGGQRRILSAPHPDELVVSSPSGSYRELYSLNAAGVLTLRILSEGKIRIAGTCARRDIGTGDRTGPASPDAEIPEGDIRCTDLWIDAERIYRARTGAAEPLGELYAYGLQAALSGAHGLKNLAFIDLVLGASRNVREVLAYAYFQANR